MEIGVTDASKELSLLGQHFRSVKPDPSNGNGIAGLAHSFGVDPSGQLFFNLVSEVRGRIDALQTFAATVVDSELDDTLRREVHQATSSFANIFRPDFLLNRWEDTCNKMLPEANLKTLLWFGQTARRHRPLRLISAQEVGEIISKLREALTALDEDVSLDWMKAPLVDGLVRLIITIEHLQFFGHEYAIEQLLALNLKISALQQTRDGSPRRDQPEVSSLWKCLSALSVVATLFMLPDQGATAISRYQTWVGSFIASTPRLPHEQRLLAPPAAVLPEEVKPDVPE